MLVNVNGLPEPKLKEILARAGAIIRRRGLVAFPTETVYGLGANALDEEAVRRIFAAKGRPTDNPLIAHVASTEMARSLVGRLSPRQEKWLEELCERFWPGPLTLVVPHGGRVAAAASAGLPTVGIRMPAHPLALGLIRAAGVPIAAPSANLSGRPSPTTALHVQQDLDGRVDLILDGGPTGIGVESTVLDLSGERPLLLRPGGVTLEELQALLGEVTLDRVSLGEETQGKPRAPGMKYRHYAPRARVILVMGAFPALVAQVREAAARAQGEGKRVGVMATQEGAEQGHYEEVAAWVRVAGSRADYQSISARIFALLREFDALGAEEIVVEGVEEKGLGLAIMNRLRKAASEVIGALPSP